MSKRDSFTGRPTAGAPAATAAKTEAKWRCNAASLKRLPVGARHNWQRSANAPSASGMRSRGLASAWSRRERIASGRRCAPASRVAKLRSAGKAGGGRSRRTAALMCGASPRSSSTASSARAHACRAAAVTSTIALKHARIAEASRSGVLPSTHASAAPQLCRRVGVAGCARSMALRSAAPRMLPRLRCRHAWRMPRCCASLAAAHEAISAHSSSVLALAAHVDARLGLLIASSGADGSLAVWRCSSPGEPLQLHARCRLEGAPLFSLLSDAGWLLAGTAAKDVVRVCWSELAASAAAAPRVERACSGHTGWVRALSTDGRCVFSVGCNFVRCWDAETLAPMGQERLFSGDVSALACFGGVAYSGGADGSLRAYAVDAAERPAVRLKQTVARAHGDRVEALAVCCSWLVSCGRDGALRVWRPDTLALEHEVLSAHGAGSRVQCLAGASGDDVLLSGGTDGCVRRWRCAQDTGALEAEEVGAASSGVRALLGLARGGCISGHQDGTLRVWRL